MQDVKTAPEVGVQHHWGRSKEGAHSGAGSGSWGPAAYLAARCALWCPRTITRQWPWQQVRHHELIMTNDLLTIMLLLALHGSARHRHGHVHACSHRYVWMHAGEELRVAYPFQRKAEELVRNGFVMQPAPQDWYKNYRGESYQEGARTQHAQVPSPAAEAALFHVAAVSNLQRTS